MDDTYYDHAQQSQQDALDSEREAYEESMNAFIEGLRTSLTEATANMDEFLMGVTTMVMYNAETVLAKYEETNLPLTKELTNPWEEAKKATNSYSGNALELMNLWTKDGGFFEQFNTSGTTNLKSPWNAGTTAAKNFKTDVGNVMTGVVSNISSNVKTASGELSRLYQQIKDTEARAASANVTPSNTNTGASTGNARPTAQQYVVTASLQIGGKTLTANGSSTTSEAQAKSAAKVALMGKYEEYQKSLGVSEKSYESSWLKSWQSKVKYMPTITAYAQGTLGTKRNEWAITDESWIGEEITLAAGKNGQLQYLKKGSAVLPADISANLIEWGKLDPQMLNLTSPTANVNVISNAINKPEFNFHVDNFLRCDNVSQDSLPELRQFVKTEMDNLIKQMNYAIKGKGGR